MQTTQIFTNMTKIKKQEDFSNEFICSNPKLPNNCPHLKIGKECASHEMLACLECEQCKKFFSLK